MMVNKPRIFLIAAVLIIVAGMIFMRPAEVQAGTTAPPVFQAEGDETPPPTVIYLFWGDGCPHCEKAEAFLVPLDEASTQIELRMYEVWNDKANQKLFTDMAAANGFEPQGVPTIFIGDQHWVGFSDGIQAELQQKIDDCLLEGCEDAGTGFVPEAVPATAAPETSTTG